MILARDSYFARIPGVIRLIRVSLVIVAMAAQIGHWGEFDQPDEWAHFKSASASVLASYSRADEAGKLSRTCQGGISCHAPALLVTEEFGLPLVVSVEQIGLAKSNLGPGQFVDVPHPPPLTRRV